MDPPEHTRVRRTTPAGAGPTVTARAAQPPAANHPRWCGADRTRDGRRRAEGEPPPLVRGRPCCVGDDRELVGTTPAGAGPTGRVMAERVMWENHPRWCGADRSAAISFAPIREPPPLVRGRRPGRAKGRGAAGTTPAGAGPTSVAAPAGGQAANHPRWCGADYAPARVPGVREEPPPLVRGRLGRDAVLPGEGRTTPAGAGPTPTSTPGPRYRPEPPPLVRGRLVAAASAGDKASNHPRWCGADVGNAWVCDLSWEPPPLVRGRPVPIPQVPGASRTTPAGAGPTGSRP